MENTENKELILEEDIINLISEIDRVGDLFRKVLDKYSKNFSNADKKQQDLLHYIEFKNFSSVAGYRIIKELKKVRKERRTAEDNVDLLNRIGSQFSFTNKKKAKNILKSKKENIKTRKYSTRYYSEKSLIEIAKKSKEKNNDN